MASAELAQLRDMFAAMPRDENATIEERRAGMEASVGIFPIPEGTEVTSVTVDDVASEWVVSPQARDDHAILYLHGGGYVIGSPATHRAMAAKLSQSARAKLLVIDYRLAPETAFPGAVEDAVKAYRWLLSQGYAPEKLAISGDSAGGGLSVATLVSLRDAGLPLPKTAALLSPWTDLTGESETMTTRAEQDPMVQKDMLLMMAGLYLDGADPKTPLASPLFADLQNLPPMLIQVGDHETLLNDSLSLAERAKTAGVDVTLEVWDEMIHVWQLFYQMLPEGTQALDRIGEYLVEKWG